MVTGLCRSDQEVIRAHLCVCRRFSGGMQNGKYMTAPRGCVTWLSSDACCWEQMNSSITIIYLVSNICHCHLASDLHFEPQTWAVGTELLLSIVPGQPLWGAQIFPFGNTLKASSAYLYPAKSLLSLMQKLSVAGLA